MLLKTISQVLNKVEFFGATDSAGPNSLAEKMNQIFPSIYIMIATLCSLFVVLIILTKFLYNPIQKMVQRRKDFIRQNIDESIKVKKEAFDLENEARTKLIESKATSQDIIAKAKIEAEAIKSDYIKQGKDEAARLIREAKDDIKLKKQLLESEMHNEILSVAIEISQKIIKEKVSEKNVKKYLDNYIGKN